MIEAGAAEVDALISLPPHLLDAILACLPLRDAVRTSMLSRTWRRRWEALPFHDLDIPPRGAVDSILLRCPGRIRRFHLRLDEDCAHRIHDWLLTLSRRGVESLVLGSSGDTLHSLHSSLFSCVHLADLILFGCKLPPLPMGFAGLPNLRDLTLDRVQLQGNGRYQLEKIIETSPSLQELTFDDVDMGSGDYLTEWTIRAPNLQHLRIASYVDYGCNLVELPHLRSAAIDLSNYVGDHTLTKFLAGLIHVWKLVLDNVESCKAKVLDTVPLTFGNLKILVLFMNFCELPPILLIFRLLMRAPNLEKLKLMINFDEQRTEANEEFQNAQWIDGMCPNLQAVELAGICWLSNEMSFIQLILSKAKFLRTLYIIHGENIAMSNEDALRELLRYKRASPQAQILYEP